VLHLTHKSWREVQPTHLKQIDEGAFPTATKSLLLTPNTRSYRVLPNGVKLCFGVIDAEVVAWVAIFLVVYIGPSMLTGEN
jgi:hypothetical protein